MDKPRIEAGHPELRKWNNRKTTESHAEPQNERPIARAAAPFRVRSRLVEGDRPLRVNRHGFRDAVMISTAFRHGLRAPSWST
jgi:hypothetical protein